MSNALQFLLFRGDNFPDFAKIRMSLGLVVI